MSVEEESNLLDEDEYDEEADSDFAADGADEENVSSSSDEEANIGEQVDRISHKRSKQAKDASIQLDSGDEATITEQKKAKRKLKKRGEDVDEDSENDKTGWRARTRAMREREKDEKKRNKLANMEGSTIDVDKMWEEMNRPGPLPPVRMEGAVVVHTSQSKTRNVEPEQNKENIPALASEEMITIKRKFKFAGEIHEEEKIVPKSSAEARLWLAQQGGSLPPVEEGGVVTQRPLRKISKFDPNYNNLDAFKINWARGQGAVDVFKAPKLNVVEKSKMDWASHVDAAGLKDELDEHAKAKEGYHGRMDFLTQVEQRKEEEARQARLRK